jgi:hypothetical protein
MSIDRRPPRVFRMLERERVELASFAREFAREQFEIQERKRAAKVKQERFQFFFFPQAHRALSVAGRCLFQSISCAAISQKDMIFLEISPRHFSASTGV